MHSYKLVVWNRIVLQALYMVENLFKLLNFANALVIPKILFWVLKRPGFDLSDFLFVLDLLPGQVHIKKVQNHEIKTPEVVSSGKILLHVRIETGIGDCPSKVLVSPPRDWNIVLQMLLGQSEVNYKYLAVHVSFTNYKIGRLDISVDKSFGMHALYTVQHLNKQCYD